jgi:hypothetical protein
MDLVHTAGEGGTEVATAAIELVGSYARSDEELLADFIDSLDTVVDITTVAWDEMVAKTEKPGESRRVGGLDVGLQSAFFTARAFLGLEGPGRIEALAWKRAFDERFALTYLDSFRNEDGQVQFLNPDGTVRLHALERYAQQTTLLEQLLTMFDLLLIDQQRGSRTPGAQSYAAAVIRLAEAATFGRRRRPGVAAELRRWQAAFDQRLSDAGFAWNDSSVGRYPRVWDATLTARLQPSYRSELQTVISQCGLENSGTGDLYDRIAKMTRPIGATAAALVVSRSAPTIHTLCAAADCQVDDMRIWKDGAEWSPTLVAGKTHELVEEFLKLLEGALTALGAVLSAGLVTVDAASETTFSLARCVITAWETCTPTQNSTEMASMLVKATLEGAALFEPLGGSRPPEWLTEAIDKLEAF